MAVTAEHYLSLSLSFLAAMIDATKIWRALCAQPNYDWPSLKALADAATSPSAITRIYEGPYLDSPSPPAAFIRYADGSDIERYSLTDRDVRGQMLFAIEAAVPTPYKASLPDANRWWTNVLGRLLSEMRDAQASSPSTTLDAHSIQIGPIGLCPPDDRKGAWIQTAEFVVNHQGEL